MRRLLLVLLLLAGVGMAGRGAVPCDALPLQPACYVAMLPGPAEDTLRLVAVEGASSYGSTGELLLTTVAVETDLDFAQWLRGAISPEVQQVRRDLLYPEGSDPRLLLEYNAALMQQSQLNAEIAAMRQLGHDFDTEPDGAQVHSLEEWSPARDTPLAVGDVIVGIDGDPVSGNQQVIERIRAHRPGDRIVLDVRHGNERRQLPVRLAASPDDPEVAQLGISISPYIELPVDVSIEAGRIGGPSAGLMFALSIIDLLDPDDLTGGAVVAGTGDIDADGTVGPVGGIQQKILGALERGEGRRPASVFLVPEANFDEASRAPVGRRVVLVPVGDLTDALEALQAVRSGEQPSGALALAAS